jgi:hypothetical protein
MCDALCGEFIARAAGHANVWIALVQKPYKGYLVRRRGPRLRGRPEQVEAERYSEAPAARASGWAAKRVRGVRAKVLTRFPPQALEGRKPKGASSRRRPKPAPLARDSCEGQSPETAACRAGPSFRRR